MNYLLHNIEWIEALRTTWLTFIFKGFTWIINLLAWSDIHIKGLFL